MRTKKSPIIIYIKNTMIKMTDFSDLENEFKTLFHHQKVCFRTQKKIDNGINQRGQDN